MRKNYTEFCVCQLMTNTTMKLIILSLCLSMAFVSMKTISNIICTTTIQAVPAPHKDNQSWKPAGPKDLSKYKLKTPSRSFAEKTEKSTQERTPFEFKKGSKSFEDICGLENPGMDRIVGGHEAAENEWPWQVALFIDDAWFCGGSIISDEYIMTAAHCADGASYFNILGRRNKTWQYLNVYNCNVKAGAHDVRASSEPHRVEITSYEGFTHPDWDSNTLENDIALVRLPEKIEFNDYIRPACLPP
jgi:hypothetical protein